MLAMLISTTMSASASLLGTRYGVHAHLFALILALFLIEPPVRVVATQSIEATAAAKRLIHRALDVDERRVPVMQVTHVHAVVQIDALLVVRAAEALVAVPAAVVRTFHQDDI